MRQPPASGGSCLPARAHRRQSRFNSLVSRSFNRPFRLLLEKFAAKAIKLDRKRLTLGVIKLAVLPVLLAALGPVLAFKLEYLFQSPHQCVHRTNVALAAGRRRCCTDRTNLGFKICQPLLKQLFQTPQCVAGGDDLLGVSTTKLPAQRLRSCSESLGGESKFSGNCRHCFAPFFVTWTHRSQIGIGRRFASAAAHRSTHLWSMPFHTLVSARCQGLFPYCRNIVFSVSGSHAPSYCFIMDIRQLQYLAALARERHFTRAAQACNVTQPTLSGRIRQLEQELGVPIVERGQRYVGLTPEGERVLKWTLLVLDNWQSLQQELDTIRSKTGDLVGRMALGVIPSALPMVANLTNAMQLKHPNVEFTILSQSSEEIIRSLHDVSIEAGITYLDNEPVEGLMQVPLYRERYCLFLSSGHALAEKENVTWLEAAQEPLCLLTPNMQNRRIVDRAFAAANAHPSPRLETNSIMNLLSSVRSMGLASIMPEYFLDALGRLEGMRAIPLINPKLEHAVGLVGLPRDPPSPLVAALFEAASLLKD
ncbi:MAG TPA: LysR family transcriptional regulator [Aestuariivirga sp.]|nr:LysR family transcriptional regulator [Aestuariivirga sp.]